MDQDKKKKERRNSKKKDLVEAGGGVDGRRRVLQVRLNVGERIQFDGTSNTVQRLGIGSRDSKQQKSRSSLVNN